MLYSCPRRAPMLSPQAVDRLAGAGVDKSLRALEKASDHTPAWIELRIA